MVAVWVPNPINQKGHNMNLTPAQHRTALVRLSLFHILIIASSNYLVQLPITIFGFHTTWAPSASRSSSWPPT